MTSLTGPHLTLSLVQFRDAAGRRGVAALRDGVAQRVPGAESTLALACSALAAGQGLAEAVEAAGMSGLDSDQRVSFDLEPDRRGRESATNLKLI